MKERIRQRASELGFDDCRFTSAAPPDHARAFEDWIEQEKYGTMEWIRRNAHKRVDPQQVLPGAQTVIALASSYASEREVRAPAPNQDGSVPAAGASGTIARYARHTDYHDVLEAPLKELTSFVDREARTERRSLWYVDTGPVLERDMAQRAGIGFIGKHTNLISRGLGNWIFLSEILTTAAIEPDTPETNRCGTCSRCIDVCPTDAITAPFALDARKCISYLTIELKGSIPLEYRQAIGTRIFGCDDCLEVCPWNRFARMSATLRTQRRTDLEAPDLVELLKLDRAGFRERFRGTPMLRTKRRGILRNVCVALGNLGDRSALPALEQATHDEEDLIAEHARWAINEIEAGRPTA